MNRIELKTKTLSKTKVVLIQKTLLEELKQAIKTHNISVRTGRLKLDYAVYYASLLNSIPTFMREDEQSRDIPLSSELLKRINSKYKKYINFLTRDDLKFINIS